MGLHLTAVSLFIVDEVSFFFLGGEAARGDEVVSRSSCHPLLDTEALLRMYVFKSRKKMLFGNAALVRMVNSGTCAT